MYKDPLSHVAGLVGLPELGLYFVKQLCVTHNGRVLPFSFRKLCTKRFKPTDWLSFIAGFFDAFELGEYIEGEDSV